jgi:hypothetical protein
MANRHTSPHLKGTPCRVSGCRNTTSNKGWSRLCNAHLMRHRKYGHPEQRSIKINELRPYRESVRKAIDRNPQVDWSAIYSQWTRTVGVAQEALQTISTGIPHLRYEREAAQMICSIASAVEPQVVFEIVSALWLLQEVEGGKIKSDASFQSIVIQSLRREGGCGRTFARPKWRPGMSLKSVGQTVTYNLTSQRTRSAAYEYVRSIGRAAVSVAMKEMEKAMKIEKVETAYREAVAAIV